MAYALAQCGWPMNFYFGYVYFNPLLKERFAYSSEDIIFHNFLLSLIVICSEVTLIILSFRIDPLKILKFKGRFFLFTTLAFPFLISYATSANQLFLIQATILAVSLYLLPADAIFVRNFPVLQRFTTVSFIYAFSRGIMYIITSFGVVYLTHYWGHWGVWLIMIPVTLGFLWSASHFQKLNNKNESTPKVLNELETMEQEIFPDRAKKVNGV
jgi:hypothetical protein